MFSYRTLPYHTLAFTKKTFSATAERLATRRLARRPARSGRLARWSRRSAGGRRPAGSRRFAGSGRLATVRITASAATALTPTALTFPFSGRRYDSKRDDQGVK